MDCVIHLAAETGTGQSMYEINRYCQTNIMGTSTLFQAISDLKEKNTVKKIILSSSRSVYGEGAYFCEYCNKKIYPDSRSIERMKAGDFNMYCPECKAKLKVVSTKENDHINTKSLYAYTKIAQEMMFQTLCPSLNIDYTIFRFQNVYGAGQSLKNPYTGILSIFSTLMKKNEDINVFEDGNEGRDFIYVSDIADGVISSIDNDRSNGMIINLGSGKETSVIEIANILKDEYNSDSNISITGDFRLGDIAHNFADIKIASDVLGFLPKVSLKEGIRTFCNWVKESEEESIAYKKSLYEMKERNMLFNGKSNE